MIQRQPLPSACQPNQVASPYLAQAMAKMKDNGRRPIHPLSAFCLFGMIRRIEIKEASPELTQKAIQAEVKREWKKLADRQPYVEASRQDYLHYKFLLDLWERGLFRKSQISHLDQLPITVQRGAQVGAAVQNETLSQAPARSSKRNSRADFESENPVLVSARLELGKRSQNERISNSLVGEKNACSPRQTKIQRLNSLNPSQDLGQQLASGWQSHPQAAGIGKQTFINQNSAGQMEEKLMEQQGILEYSRQPLLPQSSIERGITGPNFKVEPSERIPISKQKPWAQHGSLGAQPSPSNEYQSNDTPELLGIGFKKKENSIPAIAISVKKQPLWKKSSFRKKQPKRCLSELHQKSSFSSLILSNPDMDQEAASSAQN